MSDEPGSTPPTGGPPPPPPPGAVPPPPPGVVPPPLPTGTGGSAGPPPPPGGTWPAAAAEPTRPSRSKTGYIIGGVIAGLAVIGVGAFFLTRDDDDEPATVSPDTEAEVIIPPTAGEITIPDFTIPDLTIPDLTLPDDTVPDATAPTSGELPPPTEEPDGLGDDPELNALADACYEGDMEACDDLFRESELGSEYERYGDTCAGRQPEDTLRFCTVTFPD